MELGCPLRVHGGTASADRECRFDLGVTQGRSGDRLLPPGEAAQSGVAAGGRLQCGLLPGEGAVRLRRLDPGRGNFGQWGIKPLRPLRGGFQHSKHSEEVSCPYEPHRVLCHLSADSLYLGGIRFCSRRALKDTKKENKERRKGRVGGRPRRRIHSHRFLAPWREGRIYFQNAISWPDDR